MSKKPSIPKVPQKRKYFGNEEVEPIESKRATKIPVVAVKAKAETSEDYGEGFSGPQECSLETKQEAEYRLHEQYYRLFPRRALLDSWNDLLKSVVPKIIASIFLL